LELKNAGFSVDNADNGKTAIEKTKNNKYDLLLLDIVMPQLDGFKTLEGIRKEDINTPVIMLTNLSQEEEKAKAKKLGALDYIVKSGTSLEAIIDRIKDIK
jgi:DNA-binding response OmpR family regulator